MWGEESWNVRYFLALCDEKNFGRAAKRCGIAQPSLTNAIRRLERHIGGALFLRRPKTEPTPLALTLKPFFEQILLDVQRAEQAAKRMLSKVKTVRRTADARRAA